MKKNLLKYIFITIIILALFVIYFSTIGFETKKFNKQIKDEIYQKNNKLNLELKKIKFILDPLNFKINTKTIGSKLTYKNKLIELEHIKTETSLISLIKSQLIISNMKIMTKSIMLRDLVELVGVINNRPELIISGRFIKSGYLTADLELNFDENGKIKNDYKINGLLRNGKVNFIKKNNFEKINFFFDISGNSYNFKDISLVTNNINFLSDKLNITKNKNNYFVEGSIRNKNSLLNSKLIQIVKQNYEKLDFQNINFNSKNNFSFNIDNKLKLKDLILISEIKINKAEYKISNLIKQDLIDVNETFYLKDNKIKASYKKNNLSISGLGKIKLKDEFDLISYQIAKKGSNFDLILDILLSELNIKNNKFTKNFFPKINENINLKNHNITINFRENDLSITGSGKIYLENKPEQINYFFSKIGNKYFFDTSLDLKETFFKIDYLNYKKKKEK